MKTEDEVNNRIDKASAEFDRLRRNVWDRSGIRLDTMLKVFKAAVLQTILYALNFGSITSIMLKGLTTSKQDA